jgi:hypothetical protein
MNKVYLISASLFAMMSMPALAQQASPADGENTGLREILVTAQRRAENLQNVNICSPSAPMAQI